MECIYCNRICKNANSKRQHEVRCKSNPNRIIIKPSYGNKGKKHSEETKKFFSEKLKKQHRDGMMPKPPSWVGKKHSEESKLRISNSMKGNRNANHRGDRQSFYKDIRMDSSWEVLTATYLDENGFNWKYSTRGYILSDGRFYYPDFFIYDNSGNFVYLIEVKGYFREENRKKFEQFKIEYPDIMVKLWQKKELKKLGILK